MFKNVKFILLIVGLFFSYSIVQAESNPNQDKDANLKVLQNAIDAAIIGPQKVSLIDKASVNIPKDYLYIPTKEAAELMHIMGNKTNQNFVGMITSKYDNLRWFITVDFINSGYVRDNEAKDWKADSLFKTIQEGTELANEERIQNGFPAMHVIKWIEEPNYTTKNHQLVWSMLAKEDNSSESTVNYNTFALGRDGYFEFNLVTSESAILQNKDHAKKILDALHFNQGNAYEDFVEGDDKVAAYGIAALVTGVAAHKLGIIAVIGAFILKMWKLLIVIPAVLGMKFKKFFRRNKKGIVS